MSRAQAMDVMNEATTTQINIDAMLRRQDDQLDWSTDIKWYPGDPLFTDPRMRMRDIENDFDFDEWDDFGLQVVRPMFDLFENDDTMEGGLMRCQLCWVNWVGDDPCWVCGEERIRTYNWFDNRIHTFEFPRISFDVSEVDFPVFVGSNDLYGANLSAFLMEERIAADLVNLGRVESFSARLDPITAYLNRAMGVMMGVTWDDLMAPDEPWINPRVTIEPERRIRGEAVCHFTIDEAGVFWPERPVGSIAIPDDVSLEPVIKPPEVDLDHINLSAFLPSSRAPRYPTSRPASERRRPRNL